MLAILIRGPGGVGKSTIAARIAEQKGYAHIDIDKFKHVISKDSSSLRTEIAHNVGNYFLNQLIANKIDVVVEEIFREGYFEETKNRLVDAGYTVFTIFLIAPKKVLVQRDQERTKNKGEKIISTLFDEIQPLGEDFSVNTEENSVQKTVDLILQRLPQN